MKLPEKALIFIDVDGTIYSPELQEIDPKLYETIKRVQKKGHIVFLASGRPSSFVPGKLFPSLLDGYVLSHGKQVLFHGESVYKEFLPKETLLKLIRTLEKKGLDYVCYGEEKIYLNRFDSKLHQFLLTQFVDPDRFELIGENFPVERIYKIESWGKETDWDELFLPFDDLSWAYDPVSERIDINLKDAKKSLGIKKLLDYLDVDGFKTVCFGDGINDLDMFELIDFPIAVKNAHEKLKERAVLIAPAVTENGVGQVLEEYFT